MEKNYLLASLFNDDFNTSSRALYRSFHRNIKF